MRFTKALHLRALLLASLSTVVLAGTAQAQDAAASDAPPPTASAGPLPAPSNPEPAAADPAEAGGLEDIVVTARKRVETAQDIPVAVTALSGEQLQRYDLNTLEKVAAVTPQFQVGKGTTGSGAQLTLRGIGSNNSSVGIEQSVAIIVDGVYYGNGRVINEGFFDLGRLELLKGPQALFFGKNATAGVVSITTANPTDTFEGSSRLGYEFRAQQVYGEQILSGPLTDTLKGRVAVRLAQSFRGFTENLATDQPYTTRDIATGTITPRLAKAGPKDLGKEKEFVGRVTLQWEPFDDNTVLTFKAGGTITHVNDPAWNNLIFSCPGGFSQLQPGVRCERRWKAYHNRWDENIAAVFPGAQKNGDIEATYRSFSGTFTAEHTIGDISLTSVNNYQWGRSTFVSDSDYQQFVTQTNVADLSKYRSISSEFRAVSDFDSGINFLAGVLYQDFRREIDQDVLTGNVEDSRKAPIDRFVAFGKQSYTNGRTVSPFGQVTLNLIPQVEISGGLRYTWETKNSEFLQNTALLANYVVGVPVRDQQKFTNWAPEATVTWKPVDNVTLYGAYKTAYKSGGFSNSSAFLVTSRPQDLSFDQEKAEGFEIGFKTTTLDRQLRMDLTAYNFLYSNLQIDFFNGQTFAFITTNAGSARTKGIELQAEFAPRAIPGYTARGSINYNKARYKNFVAPCWTGQTVAQGCNTTAFGGLGQDLSGTPTSVAPEWTGSFGFAYDHELANGMRLGISSDARYSSGYLGSGFGNPFSYQPKYTALDAGLRLEIPDRGATLALIGKNLTNEFWISGSLDSPSTGRGTGAAPGSAAEATARASDQRGFANVPRTVQLQLTLRY